MMPILAMIVFSTGITAFADVLGTLSDGSWQTDMGGGAVYIHNEYYSSSVGKQTENYLEYTPNTDVVPIVVNGASVYGKRTIKSAEQYMQNNGLRPLIGINADYFSYKTGIPMGYTIINGRIYSKESGIQDAIGFRSDGTAFIDKIGINTSLTHNDTKISVQYINKWAQDGLPGVYLLTDDFSSSTKTGFNALYVICTPLSGELKINSSMELRVDDVYIKNGEIKIPGGKYVFVMDPDGNADCFDMLSRLAPGDTVKLANSVYGTERYKWSEAQYATSSIGGRLINNGKLGSGFEAGAAPRTAVGVKSDGNVIFYTIDGRQSGYSYGCRIETLAKRMQEIGCVDAINLDGGGSTAIGGIFPGSSLFEVTNSPSDGALRSCANYLFLRDLREKTGDPWYIEWDAPTNYNYLSGTTATLKATKVYDSGNYKMDKLTGVEFSVENTDAASSTVDDDGNVKLYGTGQSIVSVIGNSYKKWFTFQVYESPSEIRVFDETTGRETDAISIKEGEMKNIDLEAGAFVNNVRLQSEPDLFKWDVTGTLAKIDQNGVLTIYDDGSESATLHVTAGSTTRDIPISVTPVDTFADIEGHWSHDIVELMADDGIINGIDRDGMLFFEPDGNITRIQFAAIMAKALDISVDDYSGALLEFTDSDAIQPWAVNYVKAMASLGYISGKSDDNGVTVYLDPESNITRAEAFTIMGRAYNSAATAELNYTDSADIPVWARDAFSRLAAGGILTGFNDNSVQPGAYTTRAQAAALINKFLSAKRD